MIAADASDTDNKICALEGPLDHPESFSAIGLRPFPPQNLGGLLLKPLGASFDPGLKEAMAHPLAHPLHQVKDSDRSEERASHSAWVQVEVNPFDSDLNPFDPDFPWNPWGLEAAHPDASLDPLLCPFDP